MFGFFYGLAHMPLVDALTLGFTAPLMVTALSVPLLGEHVGWRRWTAVVIGFVGVLIILRPGARAIALAHIAVLFSAFF
jgi:drug/metabolite transporter (DMT)-like permease